MSTTAAPEQKKPQVRAVSPRRRALRPYLLVLPSLLLTIGILYPFGSGAVLRSSTTPPRLQIRTSSGSRTTSRSSRAPSSGKAPG